MLQANTNHTPKTLSRRSAIALVGVSAIAGTTVAALSAAPDPIFAVLDAFRRASKRASAAVGASSKAEEAIPRSQRTLCHGDDIPASCSDHPEWIKALVELRDAWDNYYEVTSDLLTTMPTTMAGLAALLTRIGRDEWDEERLPGNLEENILVGNSNSSDDDLSDAALTFFERLADHIRTKPLTA